MLFIKVDCMYYSNNLNDITNQINLVRLSQKTASIRDSCETKKSCYLWPLCIVHPFCNWMGFELGNLQRKQKKKENKTVRMQST